MNNDRYGNFVNNYVAYTNAAQGMEVEIGRRPALKHFSSLAGCTVLDFGCGPGTNGPDLQAMGATVIGIDISVEELERARQVHPDGTYLHYDGVNLAATVGKGVDAIFASFSLCTIPSAVLANILKDMRKLLKAGGELLIIDPNFERSLGIHYPGELHYHAKLEVQTDDHLHVTLGEGEGAVELFHDIYRSHADMRRLLAEAGFDIQIFEEVMPSEDCDAGWAELARNYPPFLLIKAS